MSGSDSVLEEVTEDELDELFDNLDDCEEEIISVDIESTTLSTSPTRTYTRDAQGRFISPPPEEESSLDIPTGVDPNTPVYMAIDPGMSVMGRHPVRQASGRINPFFTPTRTPEIIWCYIPGEYLSNGEFDTDFFEEEDIEYKLIDGLIAFPRSELKTVFEWLMNNDEFDGSGIEKLEDLVVVEKTSGGVEILGIAQSPLPIPWFVLENVEINQEALKTEKIPFIPIAEGISFSSEHLETVLKIHGIENIDGWFKRGSSSDGVIIYSREQKIPLTVDIPTWYGKQKIEFRKMTEEMLLPVVNMPIELSSFSTGYRPPIDDNKFRIHIWATPRDGQRREESPPYRIWDIIVNCRDACYSGTETGIYIFDEDTNYPVAELIGNNLYIHHNLTYYGRDEELQIYRRILEETIKILNNGYEKSLKEYKDNSAARTKAIYISKCKDRIVAQIQSLKNQIEKCKQNIKSDRDNIVHNVRTIHVSQASLDGLELRQGADNADYGAEYDRLIKMEGLAQVTITRSKLIAKTDKVYVTYDGVEYYLGSYEINVPLLNGGDIRIYNLDESCVKWSVGREGYYSHPHIGKDGECCFGNLTTGLAKLMGEHQYAIVLQIILKYLSSVNDKDWYLTIEKWK